MPQIKITQIRSLIKRPAGQKVTMKHLGLGKINREVVHTATPQIIGMVRQISHLVRVEEVQQ